MKRSFIFLLAAGLAGFTSLAGAEIKIGVVNGDLLMSSSPQYATAKAVIDSEFSLRYKEMQALDATLKVQAEKLQKDGATMTEFARSSEEKKLSAGATDLQRKQNAFEEDMNARREEEVQKLQRMVHEEVEAFAKEKGYDLIVAGGVMYATAAVDVTAAVLEFMKKRSGVAATAPAAAPATKPATAPPATKPAATKPAATKPDP